MSADEFGGHVRRGVVVSPPSLQGFGNPITKDGLQALMDDDAAAVRHVGTAAGAMPVDMFKKGSTEIDDSFDAGLAAVMMPNQAYQFVDSAFEQFILVPEVRVERRSSNVCPIQNVLHRDRIVGLLPRKTDQRIVRRVSRPPDAPVVPLQAIRTSFPNFSRRSVLHKCPVQVYARDPVIATPGVRRFLLTAHVTASVGWIGAVCVFLVLATIGLTSESASMVRGVYLVMDRAAWLTLVPFAFASLGTGVVVSLVTPWGLFRHYWVVFKLLINVFATVVLLIYMQTFRQMAMAAADPVTELHAVRNPSPVLHAVLALVILLVATVLAIYKPQGVTPHGRRKQLQERRI